MTCNAAVLAAPPHDAGVSRSAEAAIQDDLHLMRAEYLEMPGLHLTRRQVQRLWNLDAEMCEVLLEILIAEGFLKKTPAGMYALKNAGPQ